MKKDKMKEIIEWFVCILIAIILAILVRYFLMTPTIVNQTSMFPTLVEGDRLILNRTVRGKTPIRGQVVTFEAPSKTYQLSTEVDYNNPIAVYDYKLINLFSKFRYYVLEIGKYSYIKRVIGLPGEHIKIENGKVYINDEELKENYLQKEILTKAEVFQDIIVPDGYVFVMGDNRDYSNDSRIFGCIPINKIEGVAILRFWPLNKIETNF